LSQVSTIFSRYPRRRVSHHQRRLNTQNFGDPRVGPRGEALEQSACSKASHLKQRLANRSQGWIVKCGSVDVVEAEDGNIAGDPQPHLFQSADRSDRRDIVEGKDGGEFLAGREK